MGVPAVQGSDKHPLQPQIDEFLKSARKKYTDKNIAWKVMREKFKEKVPDEYLAKELESVWATRKTKLRVRFYTSDSKIDHLILCVEVFSHQMPGRVAKGEKELSRYDFGVNLLREAEILAGALAERQNVMFQDQHDPESCAMQARELVADLLHRAERDSKVLGETAEVS
jgi:hypothetical protein